MDKAAQKERLAAGLSLGQRDTWELPVAGTPMRLRLMIKRLELVVPSFWNEAPLQVADTLAEKNPELLQALSSFSPQSFGFAVRTARWVQRDMRQSKR